MRTNGRLAALGALAGGVLTIAWSAIFVRWAKMPGASSAFYRTLIAALVLWPTLLIMRKRPILLSRRTLWIIVAGGVFFAGDIGFWNVAVMHTSAANATFLSNCSPLFVGLFSWMLTKRLPSGRFWLALLVALIGTGLIFVADVRHAVSRSWADGLAVIAAICFALYLVITGRLRERCDTVTLLALSTTASAVALWIGAVATHSSLAVPDAASWWALLGLGLLCQVGGYFGLTYALGHLPTPVTSILFLMVAPMTAIFAWIIFGERMRPMEIVGGLLLLAAVWIVGRREKMEIPQMEEMIPPVAQV
ncbi:MAG: DMT family transporter [Acidobacteriaceae bacterium]|jgi:drug/metabolite transporter (DMT)-like permease